MKGGCGGSRRTTAGWIAAERSSPAVGACPACARRTGSGWSSSSCGRKTPRARKRRPGSPRWCCAMTTEAPARDVEPRLVSYEDERSRYRPEVPERVNPVLAIVEPWAAEDPEALALVSIDGDGE